MKLNKKLLFIIFIVYKTYFIAVLLILSNFDKIKSFPEKSLATPIYEVKSATKTLKKDHSPIVKPSDAYTILIVGDSMTDVLRPYDNQFRKYLAQYYPDKVFGIFNYGYGSTNILSFPTRLNENTTYLGLEYPSILNREFDLIFIESFGYNPLSEYPIEVGLIKQNRTLLESISSIQETHPNSIIVLMSTIAPNIDHFAKGVVELNATQRKIWVEERVKYIRNHILFAKAYNLPYLDIYEKTLGANNTGDLKYINPGDQLHPSVEGIDLINREIADFIYENRLLPL